LCRDAEAFAARGATVALITMGTPPETDAFCHSHAVPFLCLSDPARKSYRTYGLERTSWFQMITGRTVSRLIAALAEGHGGGRPVGDIMQMPGVFMVDSQGILRYIYRYRDIADNPPNEELLQALDNRR